MIGLEKSSCHLLNQSDAKPTLVATFSNSFSRAWCGSRVLTVKVFIGSIVLGLFTFVVIGRCKSFSFGFTSLK